MGKPKFDPNAAAAKFLSKVEPHGDPADAPPASDTIPEESKVIEAIAPPAGEGIIKTTTTKQKCYYITDVQYKTIKRIAIERDTDTSTIVREALDKYIEATVI